MRTPKREDFTYIREEKNRKWRPWSVIQIFVWFVDRIVGTRDREINRDTDYQYSTKYRRN